MVLALPWTVFVFVWCIVSLIWLAMMACCIVLGVLLLPFRIGLGMIRLCLGHRLPALASTRPLMQLRKPGTVLWPYILRISAVTRRAPRTGGCVHAGHGEATLVGG